MADTTTHRNYPLPEPGNKLSTDVQTLRAMGTQIDQDMEEVMAMLATASTGATNVAMSYEAGRVKAITTTLPGGIAVQAFTYNGDGTVNTITTTYNTKTRVETFAYSGGSLTAITGADA